MSRGVRTSSSRYGTLPPVYLIQRRVNFIYGATATVTLSAYQTLEAAQGAAATLDVEYTPAQIEFMQTLGIESLEYQIAGPIEVQRGAIHVV